ncbi:MAG: alpha/beta hydrolase [Halanaerobiales bacterium]|nr:alpha/beta hydrolase [Halanaerobiales bacterium]
MDNLRLHGKKPYKVVTLHGGPGALGELYHLSDKIAKKFGVIEFLQIKENISDLIKDLKEVIINNSDKSVSVLGFSWGAWLGIFFTAKYPKLVNKLILVSSGPFKEKYRKEIINKRISRMNNHTKNKFYRLIEGLESNKSLDKREFNEFIEIINKVDSYKIIRADNELDFHYDLYQKIWLEAAQLRKNNKLIEELKKIKCPIKVIHGKYDPHPTRGVIEPLKEIKKDFDCLLLKKCGHSPWQEKYARDIFFKKLFEMIK